MMRHRLLPKKPEIYHGKKGNRPYFEGWYFKHVSSQDDFNIAIICGVSRSENIEDDHSFIQIIIVPKYESHYIKFPHDVFSYNSKVFEISVGNNHFSYDEMHLDIEDYAITIKADLKYTKHIKPETSLFSPSIMGPFSYFSNMQCNHGVLNLKNQVSGTIILNGKSYDMNNATGYIEKDWGEAFPKSWIWLQGNTSINKKEDVTFMCSIASIPFGALNFTGLIAIISVDNKQFRFATYNNSKIKRIKQIEKGVEIHLKKGRYLLKVKAISNDFEKLIAPTKTGMDRQLLESINAQIQLQLIKGNSMLFETLLMNCGMEVSEIEALFK